MTKSIFLKAVNNSFCYMELARNLGFKTNGNVYSRLRKLIIKYDADISHFCKNKKSMAILKVDITEYLSNKRKIKPLILKEKLIEHKIKHHQCEICNNTTWNNQPMPIELHHIDGNRDNNLLDNLQILCPNCHAQTDNHAGKKAKHKPKQIKYCTCGNIILTGRGKVCKTCCYSSRRKVNWPTKEQLLHDIHLPVTKIAQKYNVSDTTIRNWMIKYKIL